MLQANKEEWFGNQEVNVLRDLVETEDMNISQRCVDERPTNDYSCIMLSNCFKIKFQVSECGELR